MRATLFVLLGIVFVGDANSAIIEIIEQANGGFEIFSDGTRYGGASTRAAAEKVAQKLGAQGNTINWTKASVNPTGGAAASATTGTTTGPKASINTNGTFRSEPFTRAGTQYVREELVGGQIRYKNVATGKYVSASEALGTNVPATTPETGSNLPATTTKTGANLPATTNGGGATPPTNTPKAGPAPKPGLGVGGAIMGGLSVAGGAYMMYDSVKAKDTKATWGDVAEGAAGGLMATQGLAVLNAIPVGGQIAYGAAMAVGTVIGASGALLKMFSETDCPPDPVTGQLSCCNISNLTNLEGARRVNIGDEMFGEFPYVHTCMQGKNKFDSGVAGIILDDHWSEEGEVKFCSGWVMPADGDYKIQAYGSSEQAGKVCWQWECADANMVRSGDKCVAQGDVVIDGGVLDEVVVNAPAIKAGDACPSDRLPQFATAGMYIANGVNAQTGLQKWTCAATECKDGTYLVVNDKGLSQGWCVASSYCDKIENSHINVIDGYKTDLKCVSNDEDGNVVLIDDVVVADGANTETQDVPSVDDVAPTAKPQTPCEMGSIGYRMYYGRCISDVEYQQILKQQQESKIVASKSTIQNAAKALDSIRAGFDVSVWKNEEGKFNTSRLVSDSVAGVVLGTAGGLITSSVVKKNQVENGFENIQCTVGGQSVANWGDEFVVGMK